MTDEAKEIKILNGKYEKLLIKYLILDEDLQELHKQEIAHLDDDFVGMICKVNNLEKQIFTQKFRGCAQKCKEAEANVFHCEFCKL